MGCSCEIRLAAPAGAEAEVAALAARLEEEVRRLEARYSRYREDSELSRINRQAGRGGGRIVDEETAALLDYAHTCFEQSGGLFDITAGVLRRHWDFKAPGRRPALPEPAALRQTLELVGWDKVSWRRPLLRLPLPGMQLDLGGLVKEYAADSTARVAGELGVRHGLVELGGDIRVIGPRPGGAPWKVGIANPLAPDEALAEIGLPAGALATSGDYERYLEIGGRRYSHILHPRTGWPVEGLASVSVVAGQCLVAGTAATIAILKGAEGEAWLDALGLPNLRIDRHGRAGGSIAVDGISEDA